MHSPLHVRGIACHFDRKLKLKEHPELATVAKSVPFLANGFLQTAVSDKTLAEQAVLAAQKTLADTGMGKKDIDAIVIGASELRGCWDDQPERLKTRIVLDLGLGGRLVVGVTMGGCTNFSQALRVAQGLLAANGWRHILVIETNQMRHGSRVQYTPTGAPLLLMGDVAMSYIASTEPGDFEILGVHQASHPVSDAAFDTAARSLTNMASFRVALTSVLKQADIKKEALCAVFFHQISKSIIQSIAKGLGLPEDLINYDNWPNTGHLWSSDNFISLDTWCKEHRPPAGSHFLLMCQSNSDYSAIICRKT